MNNFTTATMYTDKYMIEITKGPNVVVISKRRKPTFWESLWEGKWPTPRYEIVFSGHLSELMDITYGAKEFLDRVKD